MNIIRKVMVLAIIGLFIGAGLVSGVNNEKLDQQNTNWDGSKTSVSSMMAQSFTPSLKILTRVELLLGKTGNPTSDLIISIRSSLTGDNLASASVSSKDIPVTCDWVEFDFPDITINPNQQYYIIWFAGDDYELRPEGKYTSWGCSSNDSYTLGNLYTYDQIWTLQPYDKDLCFKTYGHTKKTRNNLSTSYDKSTNELVISTTDQNEVQIRYGISWGNDYIVDHWTDFVPSNIEQRVDCDGRNGMIGIISEDEYGAQSDWVSQKSKTKEFNNPFIRFLENHTHIFSILRDILNL